MEIRLDDPAAPAVAPLLALHLGDMHATTPREFAFALDGGGLAAPDVTFWTAWGGELLLGFGALREIDPAHGEIKSMRTDPAHLRRGAGRAILAHIIGVAWDRGYTRLSLETGTAPSFAPAVALYEASGFTPCEAFGDYRPSPHNRFMSRAL